MPNTLAHFGGQGPLARLAGGPVDAKWVLLGCVLPDVPWIGRRALTAVAGGAVDPVSLRLYAIVQASLFFSLGLAAVLALLSARPRPVFAVLGLGALLHLALDAAQTKWGSGVHFLAPLSWETTNLGWFWPESGVTLALTVAGLVYLAWEWRRGDDGRRIGVSPGRAGAVAAAVLGVLYVAAPPLFFPTVLSSGSHSLRALADADARAGTRIELDRVSFHPRREVRRGSVTSGPVAVSRRSERPAGSGAGSGPDARCEGSRTGAEGGAGVLTATGAYLRAVGELPSGSATVSVRGVFVDRRTVRVTDLHVHRPALRELASYLGLGLLAVVWIRDLAVAATEGERA